MFKLFILFSLLTTNLHAVISHSPKIVIVGAGLAGLTTGYRLSEMGHDVEVYEARNRLGGRVFTVMLGDEPAELGGQSLLDGGNSSNILALIKELDLKLESEKRAIHTYFVADGDIIDTKPLLEKYGFAPNTLQEKLQEISSSAKNMKEVLLQLFDESEVLYQFFWIRLAAYEGLEPESLSLHYIPTLYHSMLGGISMAHQSSNHETNYIHRMSLKGGNAQLVNKLAEKLGERIHLNQPLSSIEKADGKYLLQFKSGSQVTADIVVLAMPCSVYNDIDIDSKVIPAEQRKAIESIKYGTNAKILVPTTNHPQAQGAYTNGRMLSYHQGKFAHLYYVSEHSRFHEGTIQETFDKDFPMVKQLYQLPEDMDALVMAKDETYKKYFGPVGYSWPNDPYVKGSYSCISAGQEELLTSMETIGDEKVKTLFAPIDNTLFFAGEHASILLDFGGTMEAAVESGERTARLIKSLN
mgnify:CR=1 FL=1